MKNKDRYNRLDIHIETTINIEQVEGEEEEGKNK